MNKDSEKKKQHKFFKTATIISFQIVKYLVLFTVYFAHKFICLKLAHNGPVSKLSFHLNIESVAVLSSVNT